MLTLIVVIGFSWIFILFFDTIFKSCMFYPYITALNLSGVTVKPFLILWRITRFNRFLNRLGLYHRTFVKAWFRIGAVISCAIILPCFAIYISKLWSLLRAESAVQYEDESNIVPVIPGYNFPLSYWKFYVVILLVCSAFHEFGHALAASRAGISIDGFGFALFIIAPIAFVNVRIEQFRYSSRWQQMSVFCAGIWHNIVLSLSCVFLLKYFVLLISPLYYVGDGVAVYRVNELSPLSNPVYGIELDDQIYALGNCTVNDIDSWNKCFFELQKKSVGFCVPKILLTNIDPYEKTDCVSQPYHLYFKVQMGLYEAAACLHVRKALNSYNFCNESFECKSNSFCAIPDLPEHDKFVPIGRRVKPHILFVGPVDELYTDVHVSEFIPRIKFFSSNIPETVKEFLQYLLLFSNGMAILNVLPIHSLDGHYIIEYLIHICLYNYFSYHQRKWLAESASTFTVVVMFSLICVSLYKYYIFYL